MRDTSSSCGKASVRIRAQRRVWKKVASGATKWLLNLETKDGQIPYILDGREKIRWAWPLDTLAYCTEALVAADLYLNDPKVEKMLRTNLKDTLRWYLKLQNEDGSWGKLRSADQQRSPRAVTLLAWYYRQVDPDPKVSDAIRRYCRFLLDPKNSRAYGVKELLRTSGFVGLTVAEILAPGSTF